MSGSRFSVLNSDSQAVTFDLKINGNSFLASEADAIGEIRLSEEFSSAGFAYAAWAWLKNYSYHWTPYTEQHWINNTALYVNSLGFGFCDDVAGVFCRVMRDAGYDARIWGLSGHVVAEAFINGRWQLFDPDLETFYFTETGEIAGYDYILSADRDVLRASAATFAGRYNGLNLGFAYSDAVLDIYQSTANNVFYTQRTIETIADARINLPAGARMRVESADQQLVSMYGAEIPNLNRLTIDFGAVTVFDFDLPLIVEDITGTGTVRIGNVTYVIGSAELDARLAQRAIPIYDFAVSTTGTENSVSYLVNAERFSLDEAMAVETTAPLNLTLVGEGGPYTLRGGARRRLPDAACRLSERDSRRRPRRHERQRHDHVPRLASLHDQLRRHQWRQWQRPDQTWLVGGAIRGGRASQGRARERRDPARARGGQHERPRLY